MLTTFSVARTSVTASTIFCNCQCNQSLTSADVVFAHGQGARRAALNTKNKSLDSAIEWALEHSGDAGFDGPLSGEDDDGGEVAT